MALSAHEIAELTGGELVDGPADAIVTSVAIDSREVEPGGLFVAFAGEAADGHAFLSDALGRGARVALVSRDVDPVGVGDGHRRLAIVKVEDATAALQVLAAHHRDHLTCPVVAITGSSGKTTTKDLLRSVLAKRFEVVATEGNRNNELGVPLTLMSAGPKTGAVVVEMGMRGPGQILRLCEIARPDAGLVTNVGQTHIELLGSEQAIASAKGELVRCVPAEGQVFLNGDDAWARKMAETARAPVTFYGTGEDADIRAEEIVTDEEGRPSFTLATAEERQLVSLAIPGRHNAYNAAAAAAVGLYLGLTFEEIAEGLAEARSSSMRMEVFESASGVTVINDAYNANPAAMRAALRTLSDFSTDSRRVAVLGDMAELGSLTDRAHFELGEYVASLGLDVLVTVGERAKRIAQGARAEGFSVEAIHTFASAEDAADSLEAMLRGGDVVLVKASRVIGLESVVEGITKPHAQA